MVVALLVPLVGFIVCHWSEWWRQGQGECLQCDREVIGGFVRTVFFLFWLGSRGFLWLLYIHQRLQS